MRAGFPLDYLAALGARRRVASVGELNDKQALAFAGSFSWRGDAIRPTQAEEEVLWLLAEVRRRRPRVVVEIGTDKGGTLFLWSRAAAVDALLVAIDTRPLGVLGPLSPYALVRRAFARESQRVELLLPHDSHDPKTVDELRRTLGGRPVDFLFVDGDHTYDGVKDDFERYSPLVRSGGLVALHDIAAELAPGVVEFWAELKRTRRTGERIASQYGMGVVYC